MRLVPSGSPPQQADRRSYARRSRRPSSRIFQAVAARSLGQLRRTAGEPALNGDTSARPRSGARLFSGSVFLLLAVLLAYLFLSYDFYVYDVEVVGAEHLSPQEVFEASGVNEMSTFYIRPAGVAARLEELPRVEEAQVRCAFPNQVRIDLQELRIAFVWQRGEGMWGVGQEGRSLPLSQPPDGDMLWVEDQRSQPMKGDLSQELVASVLAAQEALPGVDCLTYDSAYGLTFQSAHGYAVRLGQGGIVRKVAIWRALEAEVSARGIAPGYVDLRVPSSPCFGEVGQ